MSDGRAGAGTPDDVVLIEHTAGVEALAARAARTSTIAVDVEANGLFAYRARLCTVQIAFREAGRPVVFVIDALRAPVSPLAGVLGPSGPTKVLHDLTFDARLLAEEGAPLGNVRDTSVAARLLDCPSTGLAALLSAELGIIVEKHLQRHDWARRPITPRQLSYLAEDVRYLLPLDERLAERAAALGIEGEIEDECAYKLQSAFGPPRDARPAYARVRGMATLDPGGRAILRRLVQARDAVAAADDVPPFKVAANEALLELARSRSATEDAVRAVMRSGRGVAAAIWLRAIEQGLRDGDVPEEERALLKRGSGRRSVAHVGIDRQGAALRRAKEAQIGAWRRAEAKARGVGEQVVLPGHCAHDLVEIAIGKVDSADVRAAIARIPGIGAHRLARYADALAALAG